MKITTQLLDKLPKKYCLIVVDEELPDKVHGGIKDFDTAATFTAVMGSTGKNRRWKASGTQIVGVTRGQYCSNEEVVNEIDAIISHNKMYNYANGWRIKVGIFDEDYDAYEPRTTLRAHSTSAPNLVKKSGVKQLENSVRNMF